MPVDASIALNVKPVELPDFASLAVKRAGVMNAMSEMATRQRALNEQNAFGALLQLPGANPDDPEWRKKASFAAPNLAPDYLKKYDDANAAQAAARSAALAQKDAETKSALSELFQYGDFDAAKAGVARRVSGGQLSREQADAVIARMGQFDDYDKFAASVARGMLTPEQMSEVTRTTQDLGGRKIVTATGKYDPVGTAPTQEASYEMTLSPDQIAANNRAANSERQQSTRPLTGVNAAGDMIVMSPDILRDQRANPTGASSIVIPGAGKPSGGFEKAEAARGEAYSQIAAALPVLDQLLQEGSNVDKAGGGLPTVVATNLARAFGMTTEEMKAQAKLGPEGYVLLQQVPRFEGPQSDKDTAAYKDAAGKLTNEFSTAGEKRAALEAIRTILLRNKAYLDSNPQAGAAKTGEPKKSVTWDELQ